MGLKPPQLFKPEDFAQKVGEGVLPDGTKYEDVQFRADLAAIAQAIFEKFWVENNCVMCHSKSEMKRVDSQVNDKLDPEDDYISPPPKKVFKATLKIESKNHEDDGE